MPFIHPDPPAVDSCNALVIPTQTPPPFPRGLPRTPIRRREPTLPFRATKGDAEPSERRGMPRANRLDGRTVGAGLKPARSQCDAQISLQHLTITYACSILINRRRRQLNIAVPKGADNPTREGDYTGT